MSRTKRRNKIKHKDRMEGTNMHHCINESSNGRTTEENLIELKIRTHNCIHELFGNDLPHEVLIEVIDTICKPFRDDLRQDLLDVLDNYRGKEYKKRAFKGDRPKHGPIKGKLYVSKNLHNNQEDGEYNMI